MPRKTDQPTVRHPSGHMITADLAAEIEAIAAAAVATWPPLTGQQLADIRRIFTVTPDHR